ncbi:MAG: ketopantoate reductase family protein [Dehalococcoidia bacterium]
MRYIIYGAGGIGGGIGGRLSEAGHDVVLICRGAHLEAIQRDGLLLRSPEGEVRVPVPAVGHPREITFMPDDVVILTMKTQDTEGALRDLEASGGAGVPIVCAQNGVENERLAARRFARVYGMLVAMPATFLTPGEVVIEGTPLTGVLHAGRYPSGVDDVVERVCADISASHMLADADPAVMRLKYTKLLANLGNGVQVVTSARWGDTDFDAFMREVRHEALACYQAAGIELASQEEYGERVNRHLRIGEVVGQPRGGSSTWQSLVRGHTTLEVDYLNGEIVLLGIRHSVPTPANSVVRRVATRIAADGQKPGQHSFAGLRAMVEAERAGQAVATQRPPQLGSLPSPSSHRRRC